MGKQRHNSLDDIVFENKNKAYGAYYNRITAGFDLMRSLFITIFGIGILTLVLSFTTKEEEEIICSLPIVEVDFTEFKEYKKEEKIEPIKKEEPPKKAKVVVD